MYVVAALLVVNLLLSYWDVFYLVYKWIYVRIRKPKFLDKELVMIGGIEFRVMYVVKELKPYTYYCIPVISTKKLCHSYYFHESEIMKKTGLLKELE